MKRISTITTALVLALAFVLQGCGAPPTIRSSQVAPNVQKVSRLHFVYRHSDMQTVSSYGKGYVSDTETGYGTFGYHLVERAGPAFGKHGVTILSTSKIDSKDPIVIKTVATDPSSSRQPVLHLYAIRGSASAGANSVRVSHVFVAQLLDTVNRRTIWSAVIDTSTWSGKSGLHKDAQKTLYDDAYADELFKVVIERLKSDGVII